MTRKRESDHDIDWFETKFIRVPRPILDVEGMSDSSFRVYCTLASFDPCYPGYDDLMKLTGQSRGTVSKAIKFLRQRRMIEYRKGGSLRGTNNRYSLCSIGKWDWDGSRYELAHESDYRQQVHDLNSTESNSRTTLSSDSEPQTVQQVDANESNLTKLDDNESNVCPRADSSADDGHLEPDDFCNFVNGGGPYGF